MRRHSALFVCVHDGTGRYLTKEKIFFKWQPPESFIIFENPTLSFIVFVIMMKKPVRNKLKFSWKFENSIHFPNQIISSFYYWLLCRYWQIISVHISRERVKTTSKGKAYANQFIFRIGVSYDFLQFAQRKRESSLCP